MGNAQSETAPGFAGAEPKPFASPGGPPALAGGLRQPFAPPPSSSPPRAAAEPGEGSCPASPSPSPGAEWGGTGGPSAAAWSPRALGEPGRRRWKKVLPRGRSRGRAAPGPPGTRNPAAPAWSWGTVAQEVSSVLGQLAIEPRQGQPIVTASGRRDEPPAPGGLCQPQPEAASAREEPLGRLGPAALEGPRELEVPVPPTPSPAEAARVLDGLGSVSAQPPRAPTPYAPRRCLAVHQGLEPAAPGSPRAEEKPPGEQGVRPPLPFHFEGETMTRAPAAASCPPPPRGDGDPGGETPAEPGQPPEAPRPAAPRPRVPCRALARAKAKRVGAKAKALPQPGPVSPPPPPEQPPAATAKPMGQKCRAPRRGKEPPAAEDKPPEGTVEAVAEAPPAPASRWPPFEVGASCPRRCHCKHQHPRKLPRNVSAWLAPAANHLAEPPWVSTAILAGSLVAGTEFLLDAYTGGGGEED